MALILYQEWRCSENTIGTNSRDESELENGLILCRFVAVAKIPSKPWVPHLMNWQFGVFPNQLASDFGFCNTYFFLGVMITGRMGHT